MEDVARLISDYGFIFVFFIIILYFIIKYGDKYFKMSLNRMENKNYMIDVLQKSLENSIDITKHNTKVIENNSLIIKNYTDNAHKLENKIDFLRQEIRENDIKTNELLTEIKIIKDRM